MKVSGRRSSIAVAMLVLTVFCSVSAAQTMLDMRSQARNLDFSGATWTRPIPVGTTLPAACAKGQMYFKADALPGRNLFLCSATNLWSAVESSTETGVPAQADQPGKLLGTNGTSMAWRALAGFADNGFQLIPDGTVLAELSGNNNWTGHEYFPAAATQTLNDVTDTITCNRRTVAIASASALTLTSAPTISDGADGQICVIVNVGPFDITIQHQNTLSSSNLQLLAPRVTIPAKSQIRLQFSATVGDWVQEGFSNIGGLQAGTAVGLIAQKDASGATAARSIIGTNGVVVTNGSGVAGNPSISIPGSTKGDLIVNDGTSNTRLPAGGDGQVLTADSNEAAGVKWAVPPGTVLPTTTKGDLLVYDGTSNVRLPVGSIGQILTADPSQAASMKWAAPAALPIDTDQLLAANSDAIVASQKATKSYADAIKSYADAIKSTVDATKASMDAFTVKSSTTKFCKASGWAVSSVDNTTIVGTALVTGVAAGGMIRISEWFTKVGTAATFSTGLRLNGTYVRIATGNAAYLTSQKRTEIMLLSSTSLGVSSELLTAGAATPAGVVAAPITYNLSSGSILLEFNLSSAAGPDTVTHGMYCIEYLPPAN